MSYPAIKITNFQLKSKFIAFGFGGLMITLYLCGADFPFILVETA